MLDYNEDQLVETSGYLNMAYTLFKLCVSNEFLLASDFFVDPIVSVDGGYININDCYTKYNSIITELESILSNISALLGKINQAMISLGLSPTQYYDFNLLFSDLDNNMENIMGGYYTDYTDKVCRYTNSLGVEPDPSSPIMYWSQFLDSNDFIYPKDKVTGLPLGAWPKGYKSIPSKVTVKNEYNGLIWPVTPSNNKYEWVYDHDGIDINAPVGEPVYSPADGVLAYSEYGHTRNQGVDETAYSVTLVMDSPLQYNGNEYDTVYLTHLSGITNRKIAESSTVIKVQQGDLIGFVGNAAGDSQTVGWAPHLHMTIYNYDSNQSDDGYSSALYTGDYEKMYKIQSGDKRKAGE